MGTSGITMHIARRATTPMRTTSASVLMKTLIRSGANTNPAIPPTVIRALVALRVKKNAPLTLSYFPAP